MRDASLRSADSGGGCRYMGILTSGMAGLSMAALVAGKGKQNATTGAEAPMVLETLRGAEAPLFHGATCVCERHFRYEFSAGRMRRGRRFD